MFFSFVGWIYECLYCTIKSGTWENRGFLIGPICPIYGCGASLTWLIFMNTKLFPNCFARAEEPVWRVFLICALGSAVLEYSISFLLEKLFGAKWWDYSDTPLNIGGRICLPATCGFGVAGVLLVKYVFPPLEVYDDYVFRDTFANEFVALALMLVLGMDIALTGASLTSLLDMLDEAQEKFDARMESGVATIAAVPGAFMEKAAAGVGTIASAPAKLKGITTRLPRISWRQSYHLRNIKTFVKPQHRKRAGLLKSAPVDKESLLMKILKDEAD